MKVVIVAENAFAKMSGEAFLALYYFYRFLDRNLDVRLVCHGRSREELRQSITDEAVFQQIYFVQDSPLQQWIWQLSKNLPARVKGVLTEELIRFITHTRARALVKQLIQQFGIDLVFEPSRISPKVPSLMYDLGVPVVI